MEGGAGPPPAGDETGHMALLERMQRGERKGKRGERARQMDLVIATQDVLFRDLTILKDQLSKRQEAQHERTSMTRESNEWVRE